MTDIDIDAAAGLIKKADDILLLTHHNPDGDATGSVFALYYGLVSLGKRVRVISEKNSAVFDFIVDPAAFTEFKERFVISLDCGSAKLLGGDGVFEKYGGSVDLSIDHHGSGVRFAERSLVDPKASAASEIVYPLLNKLSVRIDKKIAECIYVGITTDTGCFRYSNTTSNTLRIAADLIDIGIDNGRINTALFETKSKAYAEFETMALAGMKFYLGGRCAVIYLSKDMFAKCGVDETETHAIPSLSRQIEGVLVGMTIKEKDNGNFRVSLRTNEPVDAAAICANFGGGGHKLAAACDVSGTLESVTSDLLKVVSRYIDGK